MGSLSWEALGGQWLQGVPWAVRWGVLGGVRATWEALEAAVLPLAVLGRGWRPVRGALPLLRSVGPLTSFASVASLPLLLWCPGGVSWCAAWSLPGTAWHPL